MTPKPHIYRIPKEKVYEKNFQQNRVKATTGARNNARREFLTSTLIEVLGHYRIASPVDKGLSNKWFKQKGLWTRSQEDLTHWKPVNKCLNPEVLQKNPLKAPTVRHFRTFQVLKLISQATHT